MTDASLPPAHPPLPPEHRRRWLVRTLVAVVVVVGVIVGGPWVYAQFVVSNERDPLTLSTPTPTAEAGAQDPTASPQPVEIDGAWQVGAGSQAGYRLGEVLSGQQVTVVGRTDEVTGSLVVEDGVLTAADVVVDTASIATDESARDAYFRRALNTTDFPEATFTLAGPVDVATLATAAGPLNVSAAGTLTFHGMSQPVTADLSIQQSAEGFEVAGTIPIGLEQFGLEPPDLPFVTVDPTGTVEMLLTLVR